VTSCWPAREQASFDAVPAERPGMTHALPDPVRSPTPSCAGAAPLSPRIQLLDERQLIRRLLRVHSHHSEVAQLPANTVDILLQFVDY
ncbi:MAG: hypothetical protein WB522_08640, partial [Pseudolabrys sp.]